ncbi:MAG TPA: hypothetical protein VMH00_03770 [Candidatus Limnocylindrales bacterium]|nr:hypothetical protein [Candidatus Limnocylindrales bacterium]
MRLAAITAAIAIAAGAGGGSRPRHAAGAIQTRAAESENGCRVEAIEFDGWQAEQMTNRWLKLVFVPKIGGRLMQMWFNGHAFLFVNPKYRGQSVAPSETTRDWINYGGDKIWPMPEGSEDDQHWPGPISDPLDDGDYAFTVVSQGAQCTVRLAGPADARTGLQYTREISIGGDSPEISFRATMKNASTRVIRWSVQSVTQYDTADAKNAAEFNRDFRAYTPANAKSAYLDGYHVRSGLAEDPSFAVKEGMFSLHWLDLQAEVWVDSPGGWVAVVDGASEYAVVERFHFDARAEYPGKATVIFYKNGPAAGVDAQGRATVTASAEDAPFYMEAELNSPMVKLAPGEQYTFKTEWFPTRVAATFKTATEAGVVSEPLTATAKGDEAELTGTFGVFFAGRLVARFYDGGGKNLNGADVASVDPGNSVRLDARVKLPARAARISLRLIDEKGRDRGALGDAQVKREGTGR